MVTLRAQLSCFCVRSCIVHGQSDKTSMRKAPTRVETPPANSHRVSPVQPLQVQGRLLGLEMPYFNSSVRRCVLPGLIGGLEPRPPSAHFCPSRPTDTPFGKGRPPWGILTGACRGNLTNFTAPADLIGSVEAMRYAYASASWMPGPPSPTHVQFDSWPIP